MRIFENWREELLKEVEMDASDVVHQRKYFNDKGMNSKGWGRKLAGNKKTPEKFDMNISKRLSEGEHIGDKNSPSVLALHALLENHFFASSHFGHKIISTQERNNNINKRIVYEQKGL